MNALSAMSSLLRDGLSVIIDLFPMTKLQKMLLLLGLLTQVVRVFPQTYVIGIQDVVYASASSLALQMSNGITLSYQSVTINDASNITALNTEFQRLAGLNFDYLVYTYKFTASLVSNSAQKIMPYLVLPDIIPDAITNANMFYFDSPWKMAYDATKALLLNLNGSSIVYLDYGPSPTSSNLISFTNFTITVITITTSSPWPAQMQTIFQSNSQRFYVCAIPLSQGTLITSLLVEAMFKGQLNPNKVWIFNSVTSNASDFNIFQSFSTVGADIYSFIMTYSVSTQVTSLATFLPFAARDYVRVIAQSINNTVTKQANATQQLFTALLPTGEIITQAGFNTSNSKLNGTTINVMKVNAVPPVQKFTFSGGTLSVFNNGSTIVNLNDSSVTVRIGVILANSYFMQNSQNAYYGFSVAVLTELLKLSNFNYVYVFANDSVTGEIVNRSSGSVTYTGIVNLINQGLVDMSIIPMIPTNIQGVIYPSNVIMQTKMNMITRIPDKSVLFTIVFTPFTYNVWLGIVLIMIVMTFGFWSINKISPNHSKDCHKAKLESYSFGYSFLIIYSSFVTAKLKIKPKKPSLYIFAFILWFSTLMFVLTYTSNMIPFMFEPNSPYPFTQAANLTNSTPYNYNWGFVKNTIDTELVQNDTILKTLYNIALANWPSTMFYDDLTSQNALLNNKFILIQSDRKNGYLYNKVCNISQIVGTSTLYPMVIPMSNTWSQRFQMNNLITQLINSGTMTTVVNRYYNLGFCARNLDGTLPVPLTLSLVVMVGLFLIPVLGVGLGLICVCFVWTVNKIQRCCKNRSMTKFVYGDTYEAVVSSIDHDGVWAIINNRDRPYFISSSSLEPDLRKTFTPEEMHIKVGDVLRMKYFGKDPVNGYKRFCREMEDIYATQRETDI